MVKSLFQKLSPLTGELLGSYPLSSREDATLAVARARLAFSSWKKTTIESRGRLIRRSAQIIEENKDELARLVRQETGKPFADSFAEVNGAIEMGYMLSAYGRFPSGSLLPSAVEMRHTRLQRVPYGVAALIMTYNAPIPNLAWKIFPALMAGNTAVVKPSPHTPASAERFVEILHEAGVPEEVVGIVHGHSEAGIGLIEAGCELVSFTGSYETGIGVLKVTAGTLAKTVIELGGSNPFVVFGDSNVEKAAAVAKESAFSNAGQRCASASRVIVENSVLSKFLNELERIMESTLVGSSEDAEIGTLIDAASARQFEDYLKKCAAAGAVVVRCGRPSGRSSAVVMPAIVSGLDPDSPIGSMEVFGPIIRIYEFRTEAEALELANATDFGLTAAVWSSDIGKAERMVAEIRAGLVNINGPTHGAEVNFPFGGVKNSGNGSRDAGVQSIDEYSDLQVVSTFFGG